MKAQETPGIDIGSAKAVPHTLTTVLDTNHTYCKGYTVEPLLCDTYELTTPLQLGLEASTVYFSVQMR